MAGDEIVMPENAFLMIHDPSGIVMGTAADMRDMAATMDKIAGSMVRGYAARSGQIRGRDRQPDGRRDLVRLRRMPSIAGLATRGWSEPARIAASFRHRPLPQRPACELGGGWSLQKPLPPLATTSVPDKGGPDEIEVAAGGDPPTCTGSRE
jgi:ATP-dependent Clp protease, protease subunit